MSDVPLVIVDDGIAACANCGKTGSAVKLKDCAACRLVKYCGVDCQKAHRKQHKKACKQRVAELKDEQLYSQGQERPEGDFCSICSLLIPLPMDKNSVFNACCMTTICHGCDYAAQKRGMRDCPFCRTPCRDNDAHVLAKIQARAEKKDPVAVHYLGVKYYGDILDCRRTCGRQSSYGQKPQSLVQLKHSTALELRIAKVMEFKRTR